MDMGIVLDSTESPREVVTLEWCDGLVFRG